MPPSADVGMLRYRRWTAQEQELSLRARRRHRANPPPSKRTNGPASRNRRTGSKGGNGDPKHLIRTLRSHRLRSGGYSGYRSRGGEGEEEGQEDKQDGRASWLAAGLLPACSNFAADGADDTGAGEKNKDKETEPAG